MPENADVYINFTVFAVANLIPSRTYNSSQINKRQIDNLELVQQVCDSYRIFRITMKKPLTLFLG